MGKCAVPGSSTGFVTDHGTHAVQFYRDDDELTASAGRYLGEGLAAGGSAVVVATEAHRGGFGAGLAVARIDAEQASAAGRLVTADAAGTLASFTSAGGQLDHERFRAAASGLIGRAGAAGQPVHIYAEMVALLWDAGQGMLAIELETLWNDLAPQLPFSLLCGYPARLIADPGTAQALGEVCRLHTGVIAAHPGLPGAAAAVLDGGAAVRGFPLRQDSARAARRFVAGRLVSRVDAGLAVDAQIITAELAANAIVHARSPFTVTVSHPARGVRIGVHDSMPLPADGSARLRPVPGHGLHIVAKLAARWAAEPLPAGKIIWAELPTTPWKEGEVAW